MTTPRLLSDRYELGDTLGYGGMSEVHQGLDTRLGRDVAVKVLRADLARDPQFQLRFRREAQNAAALNHPAIVAVYDTGEVTSDFGPLPYIVMEYVDGQTLRDIVKTQGPLDERRAIEVMADVCAALDFSHRHSIIHRDVKPANIMITRSGAVKVMDFGIARALGEGQNVTQTAAVIGTAQYLSPEQARGEAVDARSDVYAAGCVLFELLTGDPPFTGDSPVAVAYQHVREDPRRPSELNPDVSPALDAIVLKALSKNPANRYQSSAEMRADLLRVRAGQSPLAPAVMSDDERTSLLTPGSAAPTRRINGSTGRTRAVPPPVARDDEWDEPERRRGPLIAIVVGVALLLGLIGFVAWDAAGGQAVERVDVPDVVNQRQEAARTAVQQAGLAPDVQQVESQVDQIGQVVRTNPAAGTAVDRGSVVTLEIGAGPSEAAVPPLAGRTVDDARRLLTERGLDLGEQTEQDTTSADQVGKIISSTPAAGENVAAGTAVAVVVGRQVTTVAVPDVSSASDADEAQQALEQAGFRVQLREVDGGGDAGSVLGTEPAAGQRVPPGSIVTVLVSRGNQIRMPDVRGDQLDDARDTLRGEGLDNIRVEPETVTDQSQDERVLDQSVAPGTAVDADDQIVLRVGSFEGGSTPSSDSSDPGNGGGGGRGDR